MAMSAENCLSAGELRFFEKQTTVETASTQGEFKCRGNGEAE